MTTLAFGLRYYDFLEKQFNEMLLEKKLGSG